MNAATPTTKYKSAQTRAPERSKFPRSLLGIAIASALGACASGESHGHSVQLGAPIPVTVATVHEEAVPTVYRVSGTVRSHNTATITSKTMGYVRTVKVRPGDRVNRGDVLIELEANDVRAGLARTTASLEQSIAARVEADNSIEAAEAAEKLARSNHERVTHLFQVNAVSRQEFDDAEARYRSAKAQLEMAKARRSASASSIDVARAAVAESQAMLDYAQITAPFSGRILDRRIDPGALSSPGTPLLLMEDDGPSRVEAAVEESHVDLKVGDPADVEIDSLSAPVKGKVAEIVPSVDVLSRAFLAKIDLPRELSGLRSGTFARLSFRGGTTPRLVAPSSGILVNGALERVFVADGAVARLRMITRGESFDGATHVLSGLSAGESVVVAPSPELHDGSPILVQR